MGMTINYTPQCPKCGYPIEGPSEGQEYDDSRFGRHCARCNSDCHVHLSVINHYTVTLEDNADGR